MIDFKNTLIIDIETVSVVQNYHELSDRLRKQWDRKAALIRNDDDLAIDELFFDRAGIYAEFGKVICIAFGMFTRPGKGQLGIRIKAFGSKHEKELLTNFKDLIDRKLDGESLILCAHNGKEFDFPYLCRRYLINGIEIPVALQIAGKKPWEIKHIDTMEMWKFGDRRNYTSLDLLAALFEINSSKIDIDGSMVNKVYYQENKLERIIEYCKQDVLVTANLFLKLNLMNAIPEHNVAYV